MEIVLLAQLYLKADLPVKMLLYKRSYSRNTNQYSVYLRIQVKNTTSVQLALCMCQNWQLHSMWIRKVQTPFRWHVRNLDFVASPCCRISSKVAELTTPRTCYQPLWHAHFIFPLGHQEATRCCSLFRDAILSAAL